MPPRATSPSSAARRAAPLAALAALLLSACAGGTQSGAGDAPTPAAEAADAAASAGGTSLPAIPPVNGPIAIRVQNPVPNAYLGVDSTFVFGTIGTGDTFLRINDTPVEVAPNGAFLAWLPTPPASDPVYSFDAVRKNANGAVATGDSVHTTIRVRRPSSRPLPDTGALLVDSNSVSPGGSQRVRADEYVRVSVRAPDNATVWLRATDASTREVRTVPLVRARDVAATTEQAASGSAASTTTAGTGTLFYGEARADQLSADTRLVIARSRDTVRLPVGVPQLVLPTTPRRFGVLRNHTGGLVATSDTDQVVIARPVPDGFYKWSLLPGTQVELTGVQGGQTRVRLDSQLETWVTTGDIVPLPDGAPAVRRVSGGLRVLPSAEWVDVIVPTGARPAFLVEPDTHRLVVTLYDTQFSPEISPLIGNDPLVQQLSWEPVATDRTVLTVRLSEPVFGWLMLWDDARRALVLRVRRIPDINPRRPLAGLTIAVDAGHPPGGATGATGLTEADAVLPVAVKLAELLRERGATVFMTRTTREAVGLTDRPVMTRRANAHAFLSVHLNAFADGTNPYVNHGTSTLFFHQPSEPLARAIQTELMQRIGQRDLGIHYQNLAIARPTWYPSALAEGLFLMFPDQEAAIKRADWQERYARSIADGVTEYFRTLGAQSAQSGGASR